MFGLGKKDVLELNCVGTANPTFITDEQLEKNTLLKPLRFPNHFHRDEFILSMVGVKLCKDYDIFKGGDFWYIYESEMRDGKKCRFEVYSNKPIEKIEPELSIKLNVYQVNQLNERELLIDLAVNTFMIFRETSKENRSKIAKINSIVGINKLSFSDRASWDILMNYMSISPYFAYSEIVSNSKYFNMSQYSFLADKVSVGGLYPVYDVRIPQQELKGLKARYSWYNSDISLQPFINLLEYDGKKLQYSESLNNEKTTGIITITFNDEIIVKANYPYEMRSERICVPPTYQCPIFKSGMVFEKDERDSSHPVFQFVAQIIGILFKKTTLDISELEQEWINCCDLFQLNCLIQLFNIGNYRPKKSSLKLENTLTNPLTFSDIAFSLKQ